MGRTQSEDALLANPDHKHWVEAFAQDEALFFTKYANAHVAVSEATHEDTLLCEMADQPQIDGGYKEPSAWRLAMSYLNGNSEAISEAKRIYGGPKKEPLLPIPD